MVSTFLLCLSNYEYNGITHMLFGKILKEDGYVFQLVEQYLPVSVTEFTTRENDAINDYRRVTVFGRKVCQMPSMKKYRRTTDHESCNLWRSGLRSRCL